jgi:hypothetical protein
VPGGTLPGYRVFNGVEDYLVEEAGLADLILRLEQRAEADA